MRKNLSLVERQLCNIQGRLFELSLKMGYDSPDFIKVFMKSSVAAGLDEEYDRLQWAGETYLLELLGQEAGGLKGAGNKYTNEVMYWSGYLYRCWHYMTGEKSRDIFHQADAQIMNEIYFGFHILDMGMAIEDLKELYRQRQHL